MGEVAQVEHLVRALHLRRVVRVSITSEPSTPVLDEATYVLSTTKATYVTDEAQRLRRRANGNRVVCKFARCSNSPGFEKNC